MKRFFILLLAFSVLLTTVSVSFADEDFQLRSGIAFGDDFEDILKKETTLTPPSDSSYVFSGKIAGYSNSNCSFFFREDDKDLISMNYDFSNSCSSRDNLDSVYRDLYQSLCRKYGKPLGNTGGRVELITGPAMDRLALFVYLLGQLDGCSGDYIDYDEWIVDCNGYHVKIDLCGYYVRNSSYEYNYHLDCSYHYYTDDDVTEARNKKKGEQDIVDNDM